MAKKFDPLRAKDENKFLAMVFNCEVEDVEEFIDDYVRFCSQDAPLELANGISTPAKDVSPFLDKLEKTTYEIGYWRGAFWRAKIHEYRYNVRLPKIELPPIVLPPGI